MIDWQDLLVSKYHPRAFKTREGMLRYYYPNIYSSMIALSDFLGVTPAVLRKALVEDCIPIQDRRKNKKGKVDPASITQRVLSLGVKFINNHTVRDICETLKIDYEAHKQHVRSLIHMRGIKVKSMGYDYNLSVITKKEWEWLYFTHNSGNRLAFYFGTTPQTILKWLKKNKVRLNKEKYPWQWIAEQSGFKDIRAYLKYYYDELELSPQEIVNNIIEKNPHLKSIYPQAVYYKAKENDIETKPRGYKRIKF